MMANTIYVVHVKTFQLIYILSEFSAVHSPAQECLLPLLLQSAHGPPVLREAPILILVPYGSTIAAPPSLCPNAPHSAHTYTHILNAAHCTLTNTKIYYIQANALIY